MKIINFKQEDICYMFKDSQVKIDRSDIWGDPEEHHNSLLTYCQTFAEMEESETAHVIYVYGQGGVGKSFVCRELQEKLLAAPYEDRLYTAVVDLQKQADISDHLKCLADEIMQQTGRQDLFPRFHLAYYHYKMKAGEKYEQEERSTKWDELHRKSSFTLAAGAASFLSSFGTVSDIIDLANEGYKYFLKLRESTQYKAVARQIETMDEKEVRGLLARYFAADFRDYTESSRKKQKKFIFLLDTVESMRYQILRNGRNEDYLEWLAGSNGLFRLLPDCLWMLFGREEIPWQNYDSEWSSSFLCKEFPRPSEDAVREYLWRLLGNAAGDAKTTQAAQAIQMTSRAESTTREKSRFFGRKKSEEDESSKASNQSMPQEREASVQNMSQENSLGTLIEQMIQQTECYALAIENSVDVYFRIWNENLRKNRITDKNTANEYRPHLTQMEEIFLDKKGKKTISNRFLQYYTMQEREVWYTLVCLGTWTDEILESLIWKGSVHNILIYEEICTTSFISTAGNGQKSIQGLMLDVIMEECPLRLKKQLFHNILHQLAQRDLDASYWILFQSAIHIGSFCSLEGEGRQLLGDEFIRAATWLNNHAQFYRLSLICEELRHMAGCKAENGQKFADEDLYLAVLIGQYFAHVFQKKEATEVFALLSAGTGFDIFSWQMGAVLMTSAEKVHAYSKIYELAALFTKQLRENNTYQNEGQTAYYHYLFTKLKAEAMMQLEDHFENAEIEKEIHCFCDSAHWIFSAEPKLAEMESAELWAKYYSSRKNLSKEFASQQIKNGIKQYRACCTAYEAEQDVNLCVMEVSAVKILGKWTLYDLNQKALKGIRILDSQYGEEAVEHPSMYYFMVSMFISAGLPKGDIALYRKMFTAYYRQFYRDGNWEAYNIVSFACSSAGIGEEPDEGCEPVELSDLLSQGILYLSNQSTGDIQNQLRLLLCYELMSSSKDWLGRNDSGEDIVQKAMLNNRLLMYFLLKAVEQLPGQCGAMEEEQLLVLLKSFFKVSGFQNYDVREKRHLLSLLELCGMDIKRTLWEAEYTEETKGKEFQVLNVLKGWQWDIDTQANIWMLHTILYVLWRFRELCKPVEEEIIETLKMYPADQELRADIWAGVLETARGENSGREAHAAYVEKVFGEISKKLRPDDLKEDTRRTLAKYDSRFGKDMAQTDSHNLFDPFEIQLKSHIQAGDYEGALEVLRAKYQEIQDYKNTHKGTSFFTEELFLYFYLPVARNHGTNELAKVLQESNFPKFAKNNYSILRAYACAGDGEGFVSHYEAKKQEIWDEFEHGFWNGVEGEFVYMVPFIHSLGNEELLKDYLERSVAASIHCHKYTKGILFYVEFLTKYIPFQEIWQKAFCMKEIRQNNYMEIYENIRDYLTEDELADTFTAAVWENFYRKFSIEEIRLTFFESEYYLWLDAKFHEKANSRLEREFPELYNAWKYYENCQKDNCLWQIHKTASETAEILRKV